MHRFFGTAKAKAPQPNLNEVIAKTDERADKVDVKIKRLDAELIKYREQLNRLKEGPGKNAIKQKALRVLQQKRGYEMQRDQIRQQSFNMEQTLMATQDLKGAIATVDAMKSATKELKATTKQLDLNKIDQMADEMEDLMDTVRDVQESLGRSYGVPNEVTDEELDAELDALGDDVLCLDDEEPSYLQESQPAAGYEELDSLKAPAAAPEKQVDEYGVPLPKPKAETA